MTARTLLSCLLRAGALQLNDLTMPLRMPSVIGEMDWRILANWRVDPDALHSRLPEGLRPRLVDGHAIAGVCLIALKRIRPRWLPALMGMRSLNAAHRVAVVWNDPRTDEQRHGVYVFRRDTTSRINALAGGRLFPSVHHLARFDLTRLHQNASDCEPEAIELRVTTRDGGGDLRIRGQAADAVPSDSVFASLEQTNAFFAQDAIGLSPTRAYAKRDAPCDCAGLEGVELSIDDWQARPFAVEEISSALFGGMAEAPAGVPASACQFDHALLMRDIPHAWSSVAREVYASA